MIKIKNHILLAPNIHEHTLERLAKYFGTSESLLKREFKSLYNLTVSEFVRSQALAKSHYLLTTGKMSIDEIAEEIGYAWRPAFEEAFKKHFNYSPSRLRSGIRRN
jgi:AraC-like DNA-binding protein